MSAPSLRLIAREWGRIGCVGFGGPPAHITLLRELCLDRRAWMTPAEFEDAVAATNLLPGPASTQLAIFCAWRLRGGPGALVGGACFIGPGLVLILALAAVFLSGSPPAWIAGAGAGAGAAVAAVALDAGARLFEPSRRRASSPTRWWGYMILGVTASALLGALVVLVLVGCGLIEVARRGSWATQVVPLLLASAPATGSVAALVWVAAKVGALSYGGGFVIIPLMQADAVDRYHWMTNTEFLNAVALGQITPGPVVHTVAAVGYSAAGVGAGLLAALIAFAPSFAFIVFGAARFDQLRADATVRAFLDGAGPAAIGAILGSAIPLALALRDPWQYGVLAAAGVALLVLRLQTVLTLLAAAAVGVLIATTG